MTPTSYSKTSCLPSVHAIGFARTRTISTPCTALSPRTQRQQAFTTRCALRKAPCPWSTRPGCASHAFGVALRYTHLSWTRPHGGITGMTSTLCSRTILVLPLDSWTASRCETLEAALSTGTSTRLSGRNSFRRPYWRRPWRCAWRKGRRVWRTTAGTSSTPSPDARTWTPSPCSTTPITSRSTICCAAVWRHPPRQPACWAVSS
mmetsp:Transcript_26704/g.70845  ORF Transcript_26704/g.70845 Transcript_26704/m.70845 type:complete len:205 (-) Transcript_26704:315-929(-)